MKILISGSRNWTSVESIEVLLDGLSPFIECVVHGDCPTGADRIASQWCKDNDTEELKYPADWDKYGKAAGPIRNTLMFEQNQDIGLMLAFGSGKGTDNCRQAAFSRGVPTLWITMPLCPHESNG